MALDLCCSSPRPRTRGVKKIRRHIWSEPTLVGSVHRLAELVPVIIITHSVMTGTLALRPGSWDDDNCDPLENGNYISPIGYISLIH